MTYMKRKKLLRWFPDNINAGLTKAKYVFIMALSHVCRPAVRTFFRKGVIYDVRDENCQKFREEGSAIRANFFALSSRLEFIRRKID